MRQKPCGNICNCLYHLEGKDHVISLILRILSVITITAAISLTATGLTVEFANSGMKADLPISDWHKDDKLGGNFFVFICLIILFLATLFLVFKAVRAVMADKPRTQRSPLAEMCTLWIGLLVLVVCISVEAWYATCFGMVDCTVMGWTLAMLAMVITIGSYIFDGILTTMFA